MPEKQTVLLLGHPNSGKTTLFNALTGLRHKTVNYPGSTVEVAVGNSVVCGGLHLQLLDSPGLRSLNPKSQDEEITFDCLRSLDPILGPGTGHPNQIWVIAEYGRLRQQLPVALQLKSLGIPVIIGITKMDRRNAKEAAAQINALKSKIGIPIVLVSAKTKVGLAELVQLGNDYPWDSQWEVNEHDIKPLSSAAVEASYRDVEQLIGPEIRPVSSGDIDKWLLHPVTGLLSFLLVMSGLFFLIFSVATPFTDAIDGGVGWVMTVLKAVLPAGLISDFITDGLVAGLGSVLVFIPQIFLLFLAMGILEGTGYLARGAVLVDRPLSLVGLNGRSFVPLLAGCACAIPAMMAARNIPQRKVKLLTQLVLPLMTCSARLPVYGLLLAMLVGDSSLKTGLAMTGIYLLSVVFVSITAAVAGRVMGITADQGGFQIELPEWHFPSIAGVARYAYDRTLSFCYRAGPAIAVLAIVIWGAGTFPSPENSALMKMGEWMAPVLAPMGVDGRVGVALLAAFAAREVFVSSLALIFTVGDESSNSLITALSGATFAGTSTLIFTPSSIIGLVLFFMISMQCTTTIAVARREMGGWKLPLIMTAGYVVAAYVVAVIAVQGLRFLGMT